MPETAVTRVFMCGRSQAVRIPKHFHLNAREVLIQRQGNSLLLTPRTASPIPWRHFFEHPVGNPDDLLAAKMQEPPAKELPA